MKKHTILWLTSWFPHPTDPLLGNFIQRQAEAVSPFCNIIVLYAVEGGETYEIGVETTNFTTVRVYFPKTNNSFLKFYRYLKAWSKGYNFIKNTEGVLIDLVHLNVAYPAGIWALWLHFHYKIPFIISEHWQAAGAAERVAGGRHVDAADGDGRRDVDRADAGGPEDRAVGMTSQKPPRVGQRQFACVQVFEVDVGQLGEGLPRQRRLARLARPGDGHHRESPG